MPRVIGIDPGTVSIDVCGLDDGRVFLDRSWSTTEALAEPARFVAELEAAGPLDLIAGPSGYGLPLTRVQDATDEDLRLAFLAAPGESGGIGGLRTLVRALAHSSLPVTLTPGVVHLPTVPAHRKVNRVDMGTADKVCAVALAIDRQARRVACPLSAVSLVLLELGGAFTAAIAVAGGRIVGGVGGWGGVGCVVEGAAKTCSALAQSVPTPREFVLSGRLARVEPICHAIRQRLGGLAPTHLLEGFAQFAKEGAQGAALLADGLAGGSRRELVEHLAIREARGTVLDHLYVIPREQARRRLGLS